MGPGPMGTGGTGKMMKPMMTGTGGTAIIIGVPTPGMPGTIFPGGGPNGMGPLAPGCTPGSAHECPTMSGVCATSATSAPTGTTGGSICFYGPITTTTTTTASTPAATIEYLHETAGGQEYYRFRIIFDPAFVDNTYGVNAIGWGTKGHTFKDLVGSDHAELSLFDGTPALVSMFDIDYITANAASACLYGALGVSGGEGKMLVGDAKYVLASTTSLDRNLNGCGYCKSSACGGDCTVDSPVTDATLHAQPGRPQLGLPRRLRGLGRRGRVRRQGFRRRQHHVRSRVAVQGEHQHRHGHAEALRRLPRRHRQDRDPPGLEVLSPGRDRRADVQLSRRHHQDRNQPGVDLLSRGQPRGRGQRRRDVRARLPRGHPPGRGAPGYDVHDLSRGHPPGRGTPGDDLRTHSGRIGGASLGFVDGERMRRGPGTHRWVVVVQDVEEGVIALAVALAKESQDIGQPIAVRATFLVLACRGGDAMFLGIVPVARDEIASRVVRLARPVSSRSRCAACRARSRRSRTPGRRWCSGTWRGRSSSS